MPQGLYPDLEPLVIGKQEGQSWAQPDGLSDISGDKSLYTSKKFAQSS